MAGWALLAGTAVLGAALGVTAAAGDGVAEEEAAAAPRGRVFASLAAGFYRSVAMRCREFEVVLSTDDSQSFGQYVVDVGSKMPSSGLALEGTLLALNESFVDFQVSSAPGPWQERTGAEPRLQRLRLRQDAGVPERLYQCDGLALEESQAPEVSLTTDTSKAFNWIRFTGYLDWARHIIGSVQEALACRPAGGKPPLVVDMGGGAGWMSALLASHLGDGCEVLCTDVAEEALELARATAQANSVDFAVELGDLFEPLQRRGQQKADFVFFYPPQEKGEEGVWRGSPDVSLLSPEGDLTHFHERFCQEAELAPGGLAWLGVNWDLLPAVIRLCCGEGWSVRLPEALLDDTSCPSALLELSRPAVGVEADTCVEEAMLQVRSAAEFQIRAVGAHSDAERTELHRRAAERGLPGGQVRLGVAYAEGRGVAQDLPLAAHWLRLAAAQGREDAQAALGRLMAEAADDASLGEAARCFREAAEHGHARAQASLGFLLLAGHGLEQDFGQAMRWLSRAAAQGDVRAIAGLGDGYANGLGVEPDDQEAVAWYRRAAEQGDVVAQTNLGIMCAQGRGLPGPDASAAVEWFRKAAEGGGVSAQLNLGVMYDAGDGVEANAEAAAEWYLRAAQQGDAQAQTRLAVLYLQGRGVAEDVEEAERWLRLAVEQGEPEAQEILEELEAEE